jgi:hypothetical protein
MGPGLRRDDGGILRRYAHTLVMMVRQGGTIVRHPLPRFAALLLACALAAGCKDRHEPVKPTVALLKYYFASGLSLK